MRFSVEQLFEAPATEVAQALADPALYEALPDLRKLSRPDVVAHDIEGDVVHLSLRYRFDGDLSSAARAVVDPARLTWVERSIHDLATHTGTYTMDADHYADRFRCSGTFRYVDSGSGCRRIVEGDLRVRVPLVGGAVERAIVSGLREHLDQQAPAVVAHLSR